MSWCSFDPERRPSRAAPATSLAIALAGLSLGAATPALAQEPPFPEADVRAWQTGAFDPDRLRHFSFAFSSGLALGITTREPLAAASGAMTLGLAKEIWDIPRSGFDTGDLVADGFGAALATIVTAVMRP